MRFLHIADLHIGKQLNDISFLKDQAFILDQIVSIAREEQAEAVLIAGDIYQKSSPQAEAMALFNDFITRLTQLKLKIFLISGNHDSEQRIAYFSELIRASGVYVGECADGTAQRIDLSDEYGKIAIHMLPFFKPGQIRKYFPDEKITCSQDAMRLILKNSSVDPSARNILLCHQFVTGAERSDSEDVSVGGVDGIDSDLFDAYDYVALGHIHKPQQISRKTLRYAGSPLKYSFSEVNHKKSVCIVDMAGKGDVKLRTVPLRPLRDMRAVEGSIDDILRMPYSEDFIAVTVHDEIVPPDIKLTLAANVFPNMMRFTVENSKTSVSTDVLAGERVEQKDIAELFIDFFRFQHNDVPPTEEQMQIFKKLCAELEEDEK